MKKTVLKILPAAIAVLVLSVSILVGCGESVPGTMDGTTWDIVTVMYNGQEVDARTALASEGYPEGVWMEFRDGKATTYGAGHAVTLDYTYDSESGQGNIGGYVQFYVNGNSMTVIENEKKMTMQRR